MEQVSKRIEGGIESKYFSVKYKPSIDNSNFKLNLNCGSLLTYMALADITRKDEQIKNLQEKFLEALSECKTEEEMKNFATFLETVAKVGGYATTFYQNNISLISSQGRDYAQQKLKKIKDERKKPVSSRVDGGFESKYFSVSYRPWEILDSRSIKCNSLLTYMSLADITRKDEQINNLMLKFCEILLECKTEEDFGKLATFMNIIASVGGYAIEFNNKVHGLINKNGKNRAQQYIKDVEKQQKANAENLENFKETYARLNIALAELRESGMKEDDEVAYLLRKYNELQSDLYDFNGLIDKEFISKCDEQIEEAITYLKGLYRSLDEIKSSSIGL